MRCESEYSNGSLAGERRGTKPARVPASIGRELLCTRSFKSHSVLKLHCLCARIYVHICEYPVIHWMYSGSYVEINHGVK